MVPSDQMHTSVTFQSLEKHLFPDRPEQTIFHWEHHRVTNGSVFYHYHRQFELNLVETDAARRIVGDDESTLRGRELILISPNLPHRWEIGAVATGPAPSAEFWVLAFSRESIGLETLRRQEFVEVHELMGRADRGLVFSDAVARSVAPLLRSLGNSDGLDRIVGYLQVMRDLCRDTEAVPIVSPGYKSSGVEEEYRLVAELIEHFTGSEARAVERRPTLEAAAAFTRMSVPTFTRFFRRMTGQSFVSYVNNLRITRACALLNETDLSIVDVCQESGFANLSHFNRQFRRHTGMQPRAYRSR